MSSDQPTRSDEDSDINAIDQQRTRLKQSATPQSPSLFEESEIGISNIASATAAETIESNKFHPQKLPIDFAGYTLVEHVGEGGAGIVFRATPKPGNTNAFGFDSVAIKMIRPEMIVSDKAARRFEKESRLHAEVDSPYITKHLEFGCEKGRYFIASEFIAGVELSDVIDQLKTMPAQISLRVIADVLRALSAMHSAGVIHRDVKPGNIIVRFRNKSPNRKSEGDQTPVMDDFEVAKLTDFGLARHIDQSVSMEMTRQRAVLGTPLYMAPEQQYESRTVDARADIYALGVTLYQMLVGRTPFEADDTQQMAEMHRVERPMPLTIARENISAAVNNLVMKALEKQPDLRYLNAAEMLVDVENILAGQPISIRLYPQTPDVLNTSVKRYVFQWTLNATPKQLWPLVADTDRFNQAIGLPAANFTYDHFNDQREIYADAKFNGMSMRWREHPFEWICEREMSVLREFETGPFEWVTSTVELYPLAGQKTRLIHRFQVKPRGWFGKLFTPFQFNVMTKRSLGRVYPQLEIIANDKTCGFACDMSFGKPPKLSKVQTRRLNQRCDKLSSQIKQPRLARQLADLLTLVADPFAARIRPIPLSEQLKCSLDDALELCLASVDNGILNMTWDVICPVCRVAAQNFSSLAQLDSHANCEVCNLDFKVEFSQSVEAIFCVHQEIRDVDLKTYCIGGPFHAPHVLAQNRLLGQQQIDIGADLSVGKYEIRAPQLDKAPQIDVQSDAVVTRAIVNLGNQQPADLPTIRAGAASIQIKNQSDLEILTRLEQLHDRNEALTAGRASKHPLFQKLFSDDLTNFQHLIELSNVYLLAIKNIQSDAMLESVGEVEFRNLWNRILLTFTSNNPDCQIIEQSYDSVLVPFGQLEDLVSALLSFISKTADENGLSTDQFTFAINAGEVMTGHQGSQPATFGKTVRNTWKLISENSPNTIMVSNEILGILQTDDSENTAKLLTQFPLDSKRSSETVACLVRPGADH